jgi:hypothetical protein
MCWIRVPMGSQHPLTKKLLPAAAFGDLRANRPRAFGACDLDFNRERRGTGEQGGWGPVQQLLKR